jgi:hypothetical protein
MRNLFKEKWLSSAGAMKDPDLLMLPWFFLGFSHAL